MQIYGPYRVSPAALTGTNSTSKASESQAGQAANRVSAQPADQLDLSSSNRLQSTSSASGPETVGGDIRIEKVAQIRRQIAEGSYDTPDKLDAALDKLLDQFA
ncbi:MAG: flagellar biosynthesis anti-sigma factor FlgM [Planctomycetota bacterium]